MLNSITYNELHIQAARADPTARYKFKESVAQKTDTVFHINNCPKISRVARLVTRYKRATPVYFIFKPFVASHVRGRHRSIDKTPPFVRNSNGKLFKRTDKFGILENVLLHERLS